MHINTAIAACSILLIVSCKKEDETSEPTPVTPPEPVIISAFSNLESGNYWVYDRYRVDSMDVADPTYYMRDSLFIAGDTVLEGHTWSVVRRAVNGVLSGLTEYWRDSSNFLLSRRGEVLFVSGSFGQVFSVDSLAGLNGLSIRYSVSPTTVPVTVPAGSFLSYMVTGTCYSYGSYPVIPEWKYPRDHWVGGIGRVKWYDYFASSLTGFRYQLVDYYVQ